MKNSRFITTGMSPCLRIFIESLLDGADRDLFVDELFTSSDTFTMSSASASSTALASDKNYN
jgi:hypothetical protein